MALGFDRKAIHTFVIIIMGVILMVAGYASFEQYQRHSRISKEIAVLEAEKERVRKENESLKERISYFATESFQESESKERLNMRKDNEFVVDIEQMPIREEDTAKNEAQTKEENEMVPNYKKWWEKIF